MDQIKHILYDTTILKFTFLARYVKHNVNYKISVTNCTIKMSYGYSKYRKMAIINENVSNKYVIQNVKGKCDIVFDVVNYTSGATVTIHDFFISIADAPVIFYLNNIPRTSYTSSMTLKKEYTCDQLQKISNIDDTIYIYDTQYDISEDLKKLLVESTIMQSLFKCYKRVESIVIAESSPTVDNIIHQMGINGIPVITNHKSDYPNVCYVKKWNIELIVEKILFVHNNHFRFADVIKDSVNKYISNKQKSLNVIYVPVYGRHKILKKCLASLTNQKNAYCFCVCSTNEDIQFVTSLGIEYINFINQPLGDKFQAGIEFAKIFYPKSVTICGSDDYLSDDYIEQMEKYLCDYDLVGKRNWIIDDIKENKRYDLKYNHSIVSNCWSNPTEIYDNMYGTNNNGFSLQICKTFPFMIGSGRMINSDFLNKINWQVYPTAFKTLDTLSLYYMIICGAKYVSIDDDKFNVCSIKDDHIMISNINDIIKSANILFTV